MAQPGSFNPKGEDWIARKFADLEREIRELKAANPFAPMGMSPTVGGVNITGNLAITGTLSLPAGIIDNEALASPITTGSAGLTEQSFAITTTATTFATQVITVPDGYTKALVMNGVSGNGWNDTGALGYLYVGSMINGIAGGYVMGAAASSGLGGASAFGVRVMTGLTPGGTITVGASLYVSSGTWSSSASSAANTNALVLFLR